MASLAPALSRPASSRPLSAQLLKLNQLQKQKQQVRRIATTTVAASPLLRSARSAAAARGRFAGAARPNAALSRQFARQYASQAPGDEDALPAPKRSKLRTAFRWVWRLTYISLLGGVAYVGYEIYQDRNPEPQVPRDPSKKTLVILGKQPRLRHLTHFCPIAHR
jgi:hypothetical protein